MREPPMIETTTTKEHYLVVRRLRDGREAAKNQARGNANLTAAERREAIEAAHEEWQALDVALSLMRGHLSIADLTAIALFDDVPDGQIYAARIARAT